MLTKSHLVQLEQAQKYCTLFKVMLYCIQDDAKEALLPTFKLYQDSYVLTVSYLFILNTTLKAEL